MAIDDRPPGTSEQVDQKHGEAQQTAGLNMIVNELEILYKTDH